MLASISIAGPRGIPHALQQFRHSPRIFQPYPAWRHRDARLLHHSLEGFPDLQVNVEDIIAQSERVAHRFAFTGTHRSQFLDIAPTGNQISASGMQINLFSGGKCIEVWSVHDSYRFLTQIGAVPHLREKREQLSSKSLPAKS